MSLFVDVKQKLNSVHYKFKARSFKKKEAWKNNLNNKPFPKTDWLKHHAEILSVCEKFNVPVRDFKVEKLKFEEFKKKYKLPPLSLYAFSVREKKLMEHFISFELLGFKEGDIYVDIASENSPMPLLVEKIENVEVFSQDLTYPPGVHGRLIGSSADCLPVADNWIDKASLQCAFEHFQGEIDQKFVQEISRKLKPGGRCVIVPLYTSDIFMNIYDPIIYEDWSEKNADDGSEVFAEIELGGHFERVYSPDALSRIFISDIGLAYTIVRVVGKESAIADQSAHSLETVSRIRYALLIEKNAD